MSQSFSVGAARGHAREVAARARGQVVPEVEQPKRYRTLFFVGLGVTLLPIVVATIRALARDWVPIGDDSYFSIRAWDVFTNHPPLLGTWTSASQSVGININNPGPLFFDLLAVPVRVFGSIDGLAIGTALLNMTAVVGIAVVAYRRGGAILGAAAMLVTAVMCWAMGSELLFDPWQPHSLLLPFLFFLMVAWALSCGDLVMLPWAVGVGSLVVETHLSYAYLVPALALWGIVGYFLTTSPRFAQGEPSAAVRAGRRASIIRVTIVSVVVGVVCWAQPVWEELTGSGEGNISRLLQTLGGSKAGVIGFDRGARLVASVLALPPFWLRPSFNDAFRSAGTGPTAGPGGIGVAHLPSLALAVAGLVVLAAVIALCSVDAFRRRDLNAKRALVTAVLCIVIGLYTAGQIPRTVFGVAAHQFRWIWPVSALLTFAVLATIAGRIRDHGGRRMPAFITGVVIVTAIIAVWNLPTYAVQAGPTADAYAQPVVRDLDRQLGGLDKYGTLLYDFNDIQFAEPYSTAIMAELQRRGVPFVVDVEGLVRQLGESRRYDGTNARYKIFYRLGQGSLDTPPGATRVAFHHGLGLKEAYQFARLKEQISTLLEDGKLKLTPFGKAAIASGQYPTLAKALRGDATAEAVFRDRQFTNSFKDGALDLQPPWIARFKRYIELQRRWDAEEIAVFVQPISSR